MGALRPLAATALGLGLLGVACGAATPAPDPGPVGRSEPSEAKGREGAPDASGAELAALDAAPSEAGSIASADAGDGGCPYGRLEDPHRGFVRCLGPGEADAGWLPPGPQGAEDAGAPSTPDAAPSAAEPPPVVEMGEPSFENGQVASAAKFLAAQADAIGRCIGEHGGLGAGAGKLKVQFLVRGRGRAEGVEIVSAKGIGEPAKECVRLLLKNKNVGPPSADPVGVTVTITLKAK
jgi:pyruvate/2-oxoglutarate dehydrogenase complex dihydrolipoamide acyltransferase (E2) component